MSKINSVQISGTSYVLEDSGATRVISLTQQEYNDLPSSAKTANVLYNITDAQGGDLSNYWTTAQTQSAITQAVSGKVDTSNVTSAVTSGSTDVLTSGGAYEQFGGLKLLKLTQAQYDALSPDYDANTIYYIVN